MGIDNYWVITVQIPSGATSFNVCTLKPAVWRTKAAMPRKLDAFRVMDMYVPTWCIC